jgi:type IV pilus assembly PilX-like protein
MKTTDSIRNEKGFILVLALVVMAAMTAIGLAIITSSTTEMLISRNETEAKKAFYLSEAGIQEALGRMALIGNTAMYVGETTQQKLDRIGGTISYTTQTFTSGDPGTNIAGMPITASDGTGNLLQGVQQQGVNGRYTVTVQYAKALTDGSSYCYGPTAPFNTCDNRIILYGHDFGFQGTGIPTKGYVPVFQIDSVGVTASGATSAIREFVTSSTLNVIPPAGNIFANTTTNPSIDLGGSGNITGSISGDFIGGGCGAGCTSVPWPGAVDMNTYLGIPTDPDLKQYASPPSPYTQTGNNAVTYDDSAWGVACNSTNTGTNVNAHICNNPASIIYIDNKPSGTTGPAKVLGGSGRGILVVTGDFEVAGNFVWEGLVYIMGNLKGNGTIVCYGDIMANGTIGFNGNIEDYGSDAVASSVAEAISIPRELRWAKVAYP